MRPVAIIAVILSPLLLSVNAVDEVGVKQYLHAGIGGYPDSNSTADGLVVLQFAPTTTEKESMVTILMAVSDIAPSCTKENNATNGCGIHIHNGTTNCDNATTVGEHFWNEKIYPSDMDPWLTVKYGSDASGSSKAVIEMIGGNGFNAAENDNHNIVIHDADGKRIACGVLRFLVDSSGGADGSTTSTSITTSSDDDLGKTTTTTITNTTTTTVTTSDDDTRRD